MLLATRRYVGDFYLLRIPGVGDALGFNDLIANGIANEFGRRVQLQFAVSRGPVGLDGFDAQIQDRRDPLTAVTLRDQLDH